jgi:hypothetical protein
MVVVAGAAAVAGVATLEVRCSPLPHPPSHGWFVAVTHGQQSAAQGSSTTVSRSDIRLIQYLDSSWLCGMMVRRCSLIGYFPTLPTTLQPYNPRLCSLMVRKWSTVPISLSYTTPSLNCTTTHHALTERPGFETLGGDIPQC